MGRLERVLQIYKILYKNSFNINEDKLSAEFRDFLDLVQDGCFSQILAAVNDIDEEWVPPGGLDRQAHGETSLSSPVPYCTFIAQVKTIPMLKKNQRN